MYQIVQMVLIVNYFMQVFILKTFFFGNQNFLPVRN